MNILVTGATGFLGWNVVRRLRAANHQVRALVHGKAVRLRDWPQGVQALWGTTARDGWHEQGLRDADAVVHCAWDSRMYPEARFEQANITGPIQLLEAADRAGVKRFIHISSVAVYGLRRRAGWPVLTEDAPLIARQDAALSPYPWAKTRLDRAVHDFGQRSRMRITILRPGLLFGGPRPPAKRVLSVFGTRLAVMVGSGGNRLPYIHVEDVVDAVERCLTDGGDSAVFNVVPTRMLPHVDFIRAWARTHGFRCIPIGVPQVAVRLGDLVKRRLRRLMGKPVWPSLVRYQIATGTRDLVYGADRLQRATNWRDSRTGQILMHGGVH